MDPLASFSGLATGIDFRSLVDQIIQVESRPALILQRKVQEQQTRNAAWGDFRVRVDALNTRAAALADGSSFKTFTTSINALLEADARAVSVSAGDTATPGSYGLQVHQLAAREKLSGDVFASTDEALGIAGEFMVGRGVVSIAATDTLADVARIINAANSGGAASGVSASVVSSGPNAHRLILTADAAGADGVRLADTGGTALQELGFLDGTVGIRNQTSAGARSDAFSNATSAVNRLLGLTDPPASGDVTIGSFSVTLDLATQSLSDIASAINTAAAGAGSAVTASVVDEVQGDGTTVKRLDISGTTGFTDANGIFEALGVLQGGRAAVAQEVRGNAFTDGDAATVASASTRLADLWLSGSGTNVQDGDTLTLSGIRGDGTTFTKTYTVGNNDTFQDLLNELNSAVDGFGAGSRTATASISADGRLSVTDDQGGDSRLSLSIVAHNEGGGTLDLGAFDVSRQGRQREVASGRNAQFSVDGNFLERSSNRVSDVIEGVTLNLGQVTGSEVTVDIARDTKAAAQEVKDFIKAFNNLSEFVAAQFSGAGAEDGKERPPLSGENIIRQMRTRLRGALETRLASGTVGQFTRLAHVGVEVNRAGVYDLDTEKLEAALAADPQAVSRLFGAIGTSSNSSLEYLSAGSKVKAGTYEVNVTQPASRAQVTGIGFGGTYVDDGVDDVLQVTDAGTGSTYSVTLSNGMTLQEIVDALNTEFDTASRRVLQSSGTLYSDAVGTQAGNATLLQDLYTAGGVGLGVDNGDTISISGTRTDGTSFFVDFSVTDISTQTVGDLRTAVADAVGADVDVTFANGAFTVSALDSGSNLLSLSVTSDNAG
ncbi:MAG: flagellar filament capping protein FliD, partial [Gemmatimonadota bacterium]|nr:flagellar filament capping protein FliD [Gemmatimonadota bacterium]